MKRQGQKLTKVKMDRLRHDMALVDLKTIDRN
ncbi:hypothetical protein X474_13395 [Dethiosulfatarculus sandiegensis]|uniref:Uncharacterized protein n=1 Tax=Dethiosulfatarculus sandiegensis TaxID=1429043 RepID=A0A0D2J5V2_9BACT|nr:hypothetical protein X474_13395 [Dethiosulfatarculus sandiegensis]